MNDPPVGDAPWLSPTALAWVERILASHQRAFGRPLMAGTGPTRDPRQAAQELFAAATVVLAHDGGADPRFVYANAAALRLWQRPWRQMVGLPSRLSAAPTERHERSAALARARQEAIANYSGIRVDSRGRRFRLEGARLWSLTGERGEPAGQAAAFDRWWWLEGCSPPPVSATTTP